MRPFLIKHWFLLLLVAGVGLSWLLPGLARPLADWLPVPAVVALSLFLTTWGLDSRRLWQALRRPWAALWALVVGYGALPPLAWLFGRLCPHPDLAFGLVLMASVPCTLSSAVVWTRLAGGDEALALLAVLLLTGSAWLFTPLCLALAAGSSVELPLASMAANLLLVLVVPVVLAQLSRAVPAVARAATRCKTLNGVAVRLLVLAVIVKAAVDLPEQTAALSFWVVLLTGLLCAAVHLAGAAVALAGGRLLGLGRPGRIAAALAGSQKTLPVALYLFEAYYRTAYPLAVTALVLYHVGQLVIDTFLADALTRRRPAAPPSGEPP
jgi:sodium/bile acid cotransporter 7